MIGFKQADELHAWAMQNDPYIRAQLARGKDQARDILERLHDHLIEDPLIYRYQQAHRAMGVNPRNTEAWMARAEQLATATRILEAGTGKNPYIKFHQTCLDAANAIQLSIEQYAVGLATRMLMATPYLWSCSVDALVRASPLPKHVISHHVLPLPLTFWSYETAYDLDHEESFPIDGHFGIDWEYLEHIPGQGISMYCNLYNWDDETTMIVNSGALSYGYVYPDDFEGRHLGGITRLLQKLAFVVSPYVITRPERIPRSIRRERERYGITRERQNEEPLVNVVELRRLVERKNDLPTEREPAEWKHHWWVSGHYRAQWYPSTKDHKVVWIGPYVKGPLEKPLLEGKVYVVDR